MRASGLVERVVGHQQVHNHGQAPEHWVSMSSNVIQASRDTTVARRSQCDVEGHGQASSDSIDNPRAANHTTVNEGACEIPLA